MSNKWIALRFNKEHDETSEAVCIFHNLVLFFISILSINNSARLNGTQVSYSFISTYPYYTDYILLFQTIPFIIIPWLYFSCFILIFNFISIFKLYYLTYVAIILTFSSPRLSFKLWQRFSLNWCLFLVRFELWNICLRQDSDL